MIDVRTKKVMVKNFRYENKSFCLVLLSNGMYGAIDHEYITNGKTNRVLNGGQMHIHDTLEGVINSVKFEIDFERKLASGMTVEEIAKEMFAK